MPVNPGKTTWTRFAPDGKTLVSGGSSAHEPLRIWESATGREVKQFSAGYRGANCGAWSPDGLRLATGSLRAGDVAEVCIWEVATGRELLRVGGHPGGVQMIEFTADGRRIISADSTGELVVWDVQSGRLCYRRKIAHEKAISSLAISRDGVILASAGRDRTVRLWELVTGQEIARFPGHEGTVKGVAIAADGRFGISGGLDAQAFLWDNSAGALENAAAFPALTEAEREALWSDLCSPDAARAQRAGWILTAHAESAVELIETRLRPLSTSQRSRIEQAVVELSHARGTVRRKAMEELRHLGESAEAPLRRARANGPSLDVRQRLDSLLESIEGPVMSQETLAAVRSVQVLERLGSAAAGRVLGQLAQGPDDDRTTIEANAAILRLSAAPADTTESARGEPPVPARAQGKSASPTSSHVARAQQQKEIRPSSTSQDSDVALALAAEIDRAIEAGWQGTDVVAAPSADDAEFLRRVSLDLTGRIPLVYEVRDFVDDPAADKRTRLIDQLVERPEHIEHLMARLRDLLLTFPGGPEESPVRLQASAPAMEQWLRESVRENRPYDAMIHELLVTPLPDERIRDLAATSSPMGFYFQHDDLGLAGIAGDTARTFLGLKLECAECHNHPFAHWTREQFWEFTACFSGILISGNDVGLKEVLENDFTSRQPDDVPLSHHAAYERAVRLMDPAAASAFDLAAEPANVREAYGSDAFADGCLLARRLVERGVGFVEVGMGAARTNWDTHGQNFPTVKQLSQSLDKAWSALLDDLDSRGLLDSTLIVWMGEFGRTPKINRKLGRDHFPGAWSTVLAGGGVRGGQIIGRTSVDGMTVEDRPVSVPDFMATIRLALGIDPGRENISNDGRPIRIVDRAARPIQEI